MGLFSEPTPVVPAFPSANLVALRPDAFDPGRSSVRGERVVEGEGVWRGALVVEVKFGRPVLSNQSVQSERVVARAVVSGVWPLPYQVGTANSPHVPQSASKSWPRSPSAASACARYPVSLVGGVWRGPGSVVNARGAKKLLCDRGRSPRTR